MLKIKSSPTEKLCVPSCTGRSQSAAPLFWSWEVEGCSKDSAWILGSLALEEFRVRTLLLVRFKRRVSADPSISCYLPEINVPYLMELTSLYLSLTEGREDNLFLLPVQTPPAQCYIALCFPCFVACSIGAV